MKKIIAIMLVLIICLSFAACKKNNVKEDAETTTAATTEATTKATTEATTVDPNYDPRDPSVDDIF